MLLQLELTYYNNGAPNNKLNYITRNGEMPETGYSGFRVREFKRKIAILHDIFQLWYGLTFNDIEKVIKFSSISLGYDEKKDNYNIIPYTHNLISVAYFQLSMLMANRGREKKIKFCNTCKKLFEVKHGSSKTCTGCKTEYHRLKTQESRDRKKKQIYNSTLE